MALQLQVRGPVWVSPCDSQGVCRAVLLSAGCRGESASLLMSVFGGTQVLVGWLWG